MTLYEMRYLESSEIRGLLCAEMWETLERHSWGPFQGAVPTLIEKQLGISKFVCQNIDLVIEHFQGEGRDYVGRVVLLQQKF
jgi:hypothetical protein